MGNLDEKVLNWVISVTNVKLWVKSWNSVRKGLAMYGRVWVEKK
jgi:hypothetical protein